MEPFTILMFCLAGILLCIGSYTDMKTREVPDYLTYGMIMIGIGLRFIYTILTGHWQYFLEGLAGLAVFFGFASLLFYLGHWGGGDSKVLIAMGVLLGVNLELFQPVVNFMINLVFAGAGYGLVWSIFTALKKGKPFFVAFQKKLHEKQILIWRMCALLLSIGLLAYTFFSDTPLAVILLALILLASSYLVAFMKTIEEVCMLKSISAKKVTEGDWIAEPIKINKKIIVQTNKIGITKEQLQTLQKYVKQNKVKNVMIKEGMPFVPAFLIALVMTIWIENILFLFL